MLRSGVLERRLRVTLVGASIRREEELPGFEAVRDFASESYNLAIGSLAAAAGAEPDLVAAVSVEQLDLPITWDHKRLESHAAGAVLATRPDVLGLSCYCWSVDSLLELARQVRAAQPEVLVVAGGPSVGPIAGEVLAEHVEVDAVARGEGEGTFVALLRALCRGEDLGRVPGLASRGPGDAVVEGAEPPPVDLAALPSPYLSGALEPRGTSVLLETSRGCRFRCRFCSWTGGGKRLRYRPVRAVEADLAWARDHGLGSVKLADPAINFHDDRLAELIAAVRRVDPDASRLRLTYFLKQELLTARQAEVLAQVPADEVIVGVESLVPEVRRAIGKPPLALRDLEDKLALLADVGPVTLSLILGLPGDTIEGLMSSLEQVLELHARNPRSLHVICLFWLAVLPGSRLHRDRTELGFRLLGGETPYLLESRERSPDDLLAMARASAELHYRNPTLRVEYFHKEYLTQDAPRSRRRGAIPRRLADDRKRAALIGWEGAAPGPGSGPSGHLEIAKIAARAEADDEVRRAWRIELVVPERTEELGVRELDELVDLDPELVLLWANPVEESAAAGAIQVLRERLPRARVELATNDFAFPGAARPVRPPSPYQWGMVEEPGDMVCLELSDHGSWHDPERVFGDVRWALEQRYREVCWLDPELPNDPVVQQGLADAIRRADPGGALVHRFAEGASSMGTGTSTRTSTSTKVRMLTPDHVKALLRPWRVRGGLDGWWLGEVSDARPGTVRVAFTHGDLNGSSSTSTCSCSGAGPEVGLLVTHDGSTGFRVELEPGHGDTSSDALARLVRLVAGMLERGERVMGEGS